jgi:xanthine dehydrogenase small subunit
MVSSPIKFLLNGKVEVAEAPRGMLALDYLRQNKRLVGSKEGCKEGDCGACTVIVGELRGTGVFYQPMTSCLVPLADLEGKHLVTIEGLNMKDLSPIQAAMVERGGTQCGFCTPGFVVAMTAWLIDPTKPLTLDGLKYAISGNLCRCTGYRPIKEAGVAVAESLLPQLEKGDRVTQLCALGVIPQYFAEAPARLLALAAERKDSPEPSEPECFVAGGTDLYVQRGEELPEKRIHFLNHGYKPKPAKLVEGRIVLDGRMTFEAFATDPVLLDAIPAIADYNLLIASWAVRTRATLGGNISNASPIADMTCLLLALGAELTLREGGETRTMPLKDLYLGYKKLAKKQTEWIEKISFAAPSASTCIHWEKVSKRAWLDIATVNTAISIEVEDTLILKGGIAVGGVSATPLFLSKSSAFLKGKPLTMDTVVKLLEIASDEYTPISDVRGSAEYKSLLARQLIMAHFVELFPEIFEEEVVHAAL